MRLCSTRNRTKQSDSLEAIGVAGTQASETHEMEPSRAWTMNGPSSRLGPALVETAVKEALKWKEMALRMTSLF